MDEQGFVENNLIEKRYDAVVHMVTAAEGAEEFYNLSNEARYETTEGARARDNALREPYLSHSKYMMVDNSCKNFEEKISMAIGLISSVVGLPTDTQVFKKYLVADSESVDLPEEIYSSNMSIKETYLNLPFQEREDSVKKNKTICVRQRITNGHKVYNYEKRYTVGGERIQEMRAISAKAYFDHIKNKNEQINALEIQR